MLERFNYKFDIDTSVKASLVKFFSGRNFCNWLMDGNYLVLIE